MIRCNAECHCCPPSQFSILVHLRPVQGNVLRSTKGIQLLPHLEELDLRCNLIASIHEVVRLSGSCSVLLQRQLHDVSTETQFTHVHFSKAPVGAPKWLLPHAGMAALRSLWLADNPLALSQLYRIDVLACFPEDQQLLLDGTRHSSAEHQTASLRAQVCCPLQSILSQRFGLQEHLVAGDPVDPCWGPCISQISIAQYPESRLTEFASPCNGCTHHLTHVDHPPPRR